MDTKQKMRLGFHLYLNYFVHGMAIVILAQNMVPLGQQWDVSVARVSMVISSLGIGRLIVLYFSGRLSDRFGRKIFIKLGIWTYIPFFLGIIVSSNVYVAYFCGILAGMANSFLDSGTYPALMELFPTRAASANVFIKAFISAGELLLPILVTVVETNHIWYGVNFILCAVILFVNFFFISKLEFPKQLTAQQKIIAESHPKMTFLGKVNAVTLTIYGYISMSTFYLVSQWLTKYGQEVLKLGMANARFLVSVYSIGSLTGVVLITILTSRRIKSVYVMMVSTIISLLALLAMTFILNQTTIFISSFVIGMSAAGGVMQVGLVIMSELFPTKKGTITGIYYTAGAISSFTIPVITGYLYKFGVQSIMIFDCFIALIGAICGLIVFFNRRQLAIEKD
ncbi:MFS transporter [Companilactobacillus sp.]|uniref:MFS transporter n=1 Tax=Companilactobacillus sp. TaxID=2767905 RepID=UPI0025B8C58F|nr:MFS transporter [Companilactobacillus sp.]MCH4009175.1 MFS transporter [Companilactobacillus sp.]MCH4050646.1 MFS transporter [Companilactobacillus sp.]MCH4077117.1 MFS transporter [Companilactobacillus sp.]MCH4125693.1 MFS transporter [Companilactobacillus sp.]MCI1311402.1 MFS transporter [Companilactobacillus sp.]